MDRTDSTGVFIFCHTERKGSVTDGGKLVVEVEEVEDCSGGSLQ